MQAAVNARADDFRQAANDEKFIVPVVIATGRQRWSQRQGKNVMQSHYSQADHKTANDIDALCALLTAHGQKLKEDSDAGRADLKNRLPFYFGGGLANGGMPVTGSGYDIPYEAAQDAANDCYRRRNVSDVAPCSMVTLDADVMPPQLVDVLTGRNGNAALLDSYRAFFHTTASSTEAEPRARIGFILAEAVTVEQKAMICAQLERQIMRQAGAEPTEAAGHYTYQGAPVEFDPSVYRDVQVNFMPEADRDLLDIFDGPQLFPEDLPTWSEADAASYASAGKKRRESGTYSVPDELTGDAAELAEWFIGIGGVPGNKKHLFTLHDHPFKSDEVERGHDTSFALQVDGVASESRFQSERATWRVHCAECVKQGKSSQYTAAVMLGCSPELAARVWGGEQLIKKVADADDFPELEPEVMPETELLEVDNFEGWRDIDLTKAPGLIGAIADDMNRLVFRPLPLATVTGALQILSMVAALAGTKTPEGGKVCFMSMTIAPSGAGKDLPQAYYQMLAQHIGLGNGKPALKLLFNAPRSDKDVYQSLFENAVAGYPVLFLIVDESQSMLGSASNKQSSEFTQGIIPTLMQMITAPRYKFAGKFIREIHDASAATRKTLIADRKRAIKAGKLLAAGKAADMDADEIQKELTRIDNALAYLTRRDALAEDGVARPALAVMMSSTPDEFEKFVNASAIESGLLPRTNVARCDNFRQRSKVSGDFSYEMDSFDPQHPQTEAIIQRLNSIVGGDDFDKLAVVDVPAGGIATKGGLVYGAEARELRRRFHEFLEADERLNAPVAGAMYCRGLAQVDTICTLAALDTGEVTPEILRYAFAHVMTSITSAVSIAIRNEERDPMQLLMVDILSYL